MSTKARISNVETVNQMLSSAIIEWFNYLPGRYADKTIQLYTAVLKDFKTMLPRNILKSEITPLHIQNYINYLKKTKHTNNTCNRYLEVLKSFFHWLSDNHQIKKPTACIRHLKAEIPKRRCLSEDEYQQLLNVTSGIENAAFQFLANTGLRRNEFRFLTYENIMPNFLHVVGKGNKQRYIPLNKICKQILSQYPQNGQNQPTFISAFEYREKLYLLCQKLARQLDIPSFGPHSFRHFFATRLIRAGVPLIKVSKILGHSSIKITEQIYIHLVPMDFSGLTDCLEI